MTVWMWSLGEGRETGEAIVVSTGATDCESIWGEGRAGNQTKAVSFLLQWDGFTQLRASKETFRINGSYLLRENKTKQKLVIRA